MKKNAYGFTIVELLIVIVVIGILAAITIVAFNGIQGRARDAERSQDTAAIQKILELYYIDKGVYPTHTQLQDPTWRAANLATADQGIFINPQDTGSTNSMVASGSTVALNKYSYYAVTSTGVSCTDSTLCTGYRMSWKLEASPTTNTNKSVDR